MEILIGHAGYATGLNVAMLGPEWLEVNGDVKIDRVMSFARSIAGSERRGMVLNHGGWPYPLT